MYFLFFPRQATRREITVERHSSMPDAGLLLCQPGLSGNPSTFRLPGCRNSSLPSNLGRIRVPLIPFHFSRSWPDAQSPVSHPWPSTFPAVGARAQPLKRKMNLEHLPGRGGDLSNTSTSFWLGHLLGALFVFFFAWVPSLWRKVLLPRDLDVFKPLISQS